MVADHIYDICVPILEDPELEEEAKIEKLEDVLQEKSDLEGPALENAILDSLWRHRDTVCPSPRLMPARHTVVRRPSPAAWQLHSAGNTPLGSPSAVQNSTNSFFGLSKPALMRAKSSTATPFISPRQSPRPPFATPAIPHSPNLQTYEFLSESLVVPEGGYGDHGYDNSSDLLSPNDLARTGSPASSLNGAAEEFGQPFETDMSPYDILRSVIGEDRTDDDIQNVLQENNFDLSATMNAMMEPLMPEEQPSALYQETMISVGRSSSPQVPRPVTPSGQQKSTAVCKYWLSHGACLRADCRFSHDLSTQVCKYWMVGNCLAGDTCIFSHDPAALVNQLSVEDNQMPATPPLDHQDFDLFPSLPGAPIPQSPRRVLSNASSHTNLSAAGGRMGPLSPGFPTYKTQRSRSRGPLSRAPSDYSDSFPTLGELKIRRKKRGSDRSRERPTSRDGVAQIKPTTMADVVRAPASPSTPGQSPNNPQKLSRRALKASRSYTGTKEGSLATHSIKPPQNIPWLETGDRANKEYLKARQEAIKHGGLRNKFLQSAAQAWNRNDARAAKALSLRGQSENELMKKAHREAARKLYEDRNKYSQQGGEIFVDLHGLHPEEAVEYLENALMEYQTSSDTVYAITGTGHHSKGGKDKVGKSIRAFLNEWRYAFQEFSVPGDRNSMGGILGINPSSFDKTLERGGAKVEAKDSGLLDVEQDVGPPGSPIPVKVTLVREPPKGPRSTAQ